MEGEGGSSGKHARGRGGEPGCSESPGGASGRAFEPDSEERLDSGPMHGHKNSRIS